eukprot:1158508-Pelagomonas_calceolata.AAC.24
MQAQSLWHRVAQITNLAALTVSGFCLIRGRDEACKHMRKARSRRSSQWLPRPLHSAPSSLEVAAVCDGHTGLHGRPEGIPKGAYACDRQHNSLASASSSQEVACVCGKIVLKARKVAWKASGAPSQRCMHSLQAQMEGLKGPHPKGACIRFRHKQDRKGRGRHQATGMLHGLAFEI